jgi:hypothetical protein
LPTKAKTVDEGCDASGEQFFRRDGMDVLLLGWELNDRLTVLLSVRTARLDS